MLGIKFKQDIVMASLFYWFYEITIFLSLLLLLLLLLLFNIHTILVFEELISVYDTNLPRNPEIALEFN